MNLEVYKIDGMSTGNSVELPKEVFGIEPNDHLIYQAIRSYMMNRRQGTVSTKNRSAVRGGGRKPWRQKGRGTARAGTSRSPIWVGGGRVFGPQPRDFSMRLPKKMKRQARISAYSYKAKEEKIMLVEDFVLEVQKTREVYNILKNLNLQDKKVLFVTTEYDSVILRCGRNIPNLYIRSAAEVSTYDLLNCEILLIQHNALDKIKEVCTV